MSFTNPEELDRLTAQVRDWQTRWKAPLDKWLAVNSERQPEFARMIEQTPELLRLVVNLLKDQRTPDEEKQLLSTVAQSVFNQHDDLPEDEMGVVGLVDDVLRMAGALNLMIGRYSPLLVNNWMGKGNVLDLIEYIDNQRDNYLKGSAQQS